MGQLTRAVGEFISGMSFDALPPSAIRAVKNALADYAGVTVLGRYEQVTRIVSSFETTGSVGEARVLFSRLRASARSAALINGTSGHALDYDDVGIAFHPAHPSVVIAPAIFAQAERMGASGRDLITAYVTAYEVWSELASRDEDPQHINGWHPTGVFGTIAAAAGVAKLLRLGVEGSIRAVAIAASQAAGLGANFGTMTKPFHAGHAAVSGLMAAQYANAGMTSNPGMFDDPRGFLFAVSPRGKVDFRRPAHFSDGLHILDWGMSVKLYPMCYATHRILDTLIPFANHKNLQADEIDSVLFRTGPSRVVPLVHVDPRNSLDAKFSAEFAIAMSIIARRATLSELNDDFVNRADIRGLMGKVTRELDPARDMASFKEEPDDDLVFCMRDGSTQVLKLAAPCDQAISLAPHTLWLKFMDCTSTAMDAVTARQLFDSIQSLEFLEDVNKLPAPQLAADPPMGAI